MIEDGALDGVQAIFGQHVDPEVAVGDVATRPGPMMAAAESFRLTIFGQVSHAAFPHQGLDAIALTTQVLGSLHQIVSRRLNPVHPAVITVGTIRGGTKSNVLAGEVRMTGTIRTFDDETRARLIEEMHRSAGIARTLGGDYELEILPGTVPLVNDPGLFSFARSVISELIGEEHFLEAPIRMGGEDFSFFAREVPGLFLRLGVRAPGAPVRPLHTPTFDLDEQALPIGAAVLSTLAVRWLEENA
jgi:amidohydrolase